MRQAVGDWPVTTGMELPLVKILDENG